MVYKIPISLFFTGLIVVSIISIAVPFIVSDYGWEPVKTPEILKAEEAENPPATVAIGIMPPKNSSLNENDTS